MCTGYNNNTNNNNDNDDDDDDDNNNNNNTLRRVRKILETKLNGKNVIKAINTWAVALLRYSATFLQWTRLEKEELDRRTQKLLTMHKGLHPRSNVDRVYIPRSEGGRSLQRVEDIIELAIL